MKIESTNTITTVALSAQRTVNLQPALYRLRANKDGTITLQGLFSWSQGSLNGSDWKDIPTVQEE